MKNNNVVLGIDTSNYTTSVACSDRQGTVVSDRRIPLVVKQGERGLRQSHALFQHIENLPELLEQVLTKECSSQIGAIAVSSRPRPVDGSYMPVFKGGLQFGRALAAAYDVPLLTFSHQEGHLAAAAYGTGLDTTAPYLAYHLSGGTCELLLVKDHTFSIIGGTKDISFGQVLDRVGVAMGLSFPCGAVLDQLASEAKQTGTSSFLLKPIPIDGLYVNLSGLESQVQRAVNLMSDQEREQQLGTVAYAILQSIRTCLAVLTKRAVKETGISDVLFTGGVSASGFLRSQLLSSDETGTIRLFFGDPKLASDNAVGISLLGGQTLWR